MAALRIIPFVLLFTFPGLALAQMNQPQGPSMNEQQHAQSTTAADVLSKLHQINLEEMALGKLAETRGATKDVREYGSMLMKEHEKLDERVMKTAKEENIALRTPKETMGGQTQAKAEPPSVTRLTSLQGAQFDREFLDEMVRGHLQAVSMVAQAKAGMEKDPAMRKLLDKAQPVLEKHLKKAQELQVKAAAEPKGGATQ